MTWASAVTFGGSTIGSPMMIESLGDGRVVPVALLNTTA